MQPGFEPKLQAPPKLTNPIQLLHTSGLCVLQFKQKHPKLDSLPRNLQEMVHIYKITV